MASDATKAPSESRAAALDALVEALEKPRDTAIVLVEGEVGSGRAGLVRSALQGGRNNQADSREVRWLRLEGFEPGEDLGVFVSFRQRVGAATPTTRVRPACGSTWNASLISLGETPASHGNGRNELVRALGHGSAAGGTVLVLPDPSLVPSHVLSAILRLSESDSQLVIVLLVRRWELQDRALPPLPLTTLRLGVKTPTHSQVAREVRETWSAALWKLLQGDLPAPVANSGADALPRFLAFASRCGDAFPAQGLLRALRVPAESRESFIDQVLDGVLTECGILQDLEYGHPSFPGEIVYRFREPLFRLAIQQTIPEHHWMPVADGVFEYFQEVFARSGRGSRRLLLELASTLGRPERHGLLMELSLGASDHEASDLERFVRFSLERQYLTASTVLEQLQSHSQNWTGVCRLALLDAHDALTCGEKQAPRLEASAERILALADLERWQAAEALATSLDAALDPRGADGRRIAAIARSVAGRAALARGDRLTARRHLAAVIETFAESEIDATGSVFTEGRLIAGEIADRALDATVSTVLQMAFSLSREIASFLGVPRADLWSTIGDSLRQIGEPRLAIIVLQRTLVVGLSEFSGGVFRRAITLRNLADLEMEIGDLDSARCRLESALSLDAPLFGEGDEQVWTIRNTLIDLHIAVGDLRAAKSHLLGTLELCRRFPEQDFADLDVILRKLGDVCCGLKDWEGQRKALTEALLREEARYGAEDPRLLVLLKQLADVEMKLGESESAVAHRWRALQIEERLFGALDSRLLPSLARLVEALAGAGDVDASKSLLDRAATIRGTSL